MKVFYIRCAVPFLLVENFRLPCNSYQQFVAWICEFSAKRSISE